MSPFSSLRSRIFVTTATLTLVAIGLSVYVVNRSVTSEAELELQRGIRETAAIVDNLRARQVETFTVTARLIADLPKLIAAVTTDDPATVQDVAAEYRSQLKLDSMIATNTRGRVLAAFGSASERAAAISQQPSVRAALTGRDSFALLPQPGGMLQVATVPILITAVHQRPEIQGTLSVGSLIDDAFARTLKATTGSDVVFGLDGQVLASSLDDEQRSAVGPLLQTTGVSHVRLGNDDFLALPQRLSAAAGGADQSTQPVVLILRSRTEQLRFLSRLHTTLGVAAVFVAGLALVLSFAVARTITRSLATITDVMRDMAATGDLTRKIPIREHGGWQDEDARLLATTFNTLTDSITRFQREMSQKERLSSLGRMSTVIAHEIRNPLMIIKAALHGLQKPEVPPEAVREAVADIDGEVARLNRIVNEVLDFARPIRFETGPLDLNALCRESAAAEQAASGGPPIALLFDPALPTVITDGVRLRQVLVNLIDNARHAVNGQLGMDDGRNTTASAEREPSIMVSTSYAYGRASILVSDRGVGITPDDLAHVFDPYFTTKRGGTGLGLAISKNIVEGLGGSIAVSSRTAEGTDIVIELPIASTGAAA